MKAHPAIIFLASAFTASLAMAEPSAPVNEQPSFMPRPVKVALIGRTPGFKVKNPSDLKPETLIVPALASVLGKEGYQIKVTPEKITLRAAEPNGIFYARQTLAQAVVKDEKGDPAIPTMTIEDKPRFAWRGLLIDSSRHFFGPPAIKRMMDLMALHKLNILHLHLSDDHGWRVVIKKYPKLTEVGSNRIGTPKCGDKDVQDGVPYGGFYTQEDIKDLNAYAKAHFITIIPEIEMPGHSAAALAAYPEFGNKDVPGYKPVVSPWWRVFGYTFSPSEETFTFIDGVISEVSAMFPDSPYIHIGGDEAEKAQWDQSPAVQKLMAEKGLKDGHEVQSYFIHRVEKIVNAHGKRLIGWDEIQEGGLSKTATMMVWRKWESAAIAAQQGNDMVIAMYANTYLDHGQPCTPAGPAFENQGNDMPMEKVYNFDPIPNDLKPEQYKQVLGCQGQLWSELIPTMGKWEYMAFPRACAIAEVAWSPKEGKDLQDFLKRLAIHEKRLDSLKVNYQKDDGSPAQPDAPMLP